MFLAFVESLTGSLAAQQSAGKFSLWGLVPLPRPEWLRLSHYDTLWLVWQLGVVPRRGCTNAKLGGPATLERCRGYNSPLSQRGCATPSHTVLSPDGKTVGFHSVRRFVSICRVYTASANNVFVPRLIVKPETKYK